MKILQINSVVNTGSTGRIAEEIGQAIIKNGSKSYIAYGRFKRTSKSELIKIGDELDIKMHGVITRLFDNHGFASHYATKKLVNKIIKIKPNIIHLHNLHGYYLNVQVLFEYLSVADIPVVWTLHDCWPMTGHCVHFENVKCQKWTFGCSECPQISDYPSSYIYDNSKTNYIQKKRLFTSVNQMVIVPVSQWLNNIVKKSYMKDYPSTVINNGINIEMFYPKNNLEIREKYNIKNKLIILGVANTWSERKGLGDFIKISKLINADSVIVLVGLDKRKIRLLPDNIIGIPRTQNIDELVELYSTSDIFINPSLEETFGLTTIEAMACGTPAVVYNSTACPEVISPDTGFVVQKNDINGILQAINCVKSNGKEKYLRKCVQRITQNYNKTDKYREYIDLYENILKNKN